MSSGVSRVRAVLAGELSPAPARDAATVLLLRDTAGVGVEVCLLRRSARLAFAAGMYAFPGGVVEPADSAADIAWLGPPPAVWAGRLGCEVSRARGYLCAAVRETFEECGVLLAGRDPADVVADTGGAGWETRRHALAAGSHTLAQVLAGDSLAVRADLLAAWAHWVTPAVGERRYDTWFFVARAGVGQRARNASTETDRMCWVAPAAALAHHQRGDWAMMLPTHTVLSEVAGYPSVAAVLAAAPGRRLPRVEPTAVLDGDEVRFLLPDDPAGDDPSLGDQAPLGDQSSQAPLGDQAPAPGSVRLA